jgi:hypothetical protein
MTPHHVEEHVQMPRKLNLRNNPGGSVNISIFSEDHDALTIYAMRRRMTLKQALHKLLKIALPIELSRKTQDNMFDHPEIP